MLSYPDFIYKQIIFHIVTGFGEKLKFKADNIVIEAKEGKTLLQHSCHRIFALFIVGEISITGYLLRQALRFQFPIILMGHNFRVYSRLNNAAQGNTLLRRKQYCSSNSLPLAKYLIEQKVANQLTLLQSLRYHSQADLEAISYLKNINLQECNNVRSLMGLEGNASRCFFQAYFRNLNWLRREPRVKRDIPNLLLDIGYTLLFNFVEGMLCLYGFDIYCGILHTLFFQRKSLVCDFVEPFRCIIDRRIRKAHNLGQIYEQDFFWKDNRWNLSYNSQSHYIKLFVKDILSEKEPIFRFCQAYYRCFMREDPIEKFPRYKIGKGLV